MTRDEADRLVEALDDYFSARAAEREADADDGAMYCPRREAMEAREALVVVLMTLEAA